jgi:hypothetical protein
MDIKQHLRLVFAFAGLLLGILLLVAALFSVAGPGFKVASTLGGLLLVYAGLYGTGRLFKEVDAEKERKASTGPVGSVESSGNPPALMRGFRAVALSILGGVGLLVGVTGLLLTVVGSGAIIVDLLQDHAEVERWVYPAALAGVLMTVVGFKFYRWLSQKALEA